MSTAPQSRTPLQESLAEIAHQIAEEHHWKIGLDFQETPHLVEGDISHQHWEISLTVHPKGDELLVSLLSVAPDEGEESMRTLVRSICWHEMGHWEYCPFDGKWTAQIVEGISQGVSQSRRQFVVQETVIRRLTNMFCDIVVNTCLTQWGAQRGEWIEGIALFYLNQWQLPTPPMPADYAIFTAIQSRLYLEGNASGQPAQQLVQTIAARLPSHIGRKGSQSIERCVRLLVPPYRCRRNVPLGEEAAWAIEKREEWNHKACEFA